MVKCMDCGKEMRPADPGLWTEVTGFTAQRNQGGANAVALRKPTGNYLCTGCMESRKAGGSGKQGTLLG